MIDSRFAVSAAMLIALAAVPTGIHTYGNLELEDGLALSRIPETLGGNRSVPADRKEQWVMNQFAGADWIERVYRVGTDDVRLFAVRSYDWKRLYHHPENALVRGGDTRRIGVVRVAPTPDVPLHAMTTSRGGRTGTVVYALHAGDRYLESPIAFQILSAPAMLYQGKKPMTLLLASDLAGTPTDLQAAPAVRILLSAVDSFGPGRR